MARARQCCHYRAVRRGQIWAGAAWREAVSLSLPAERRAFKDASERIPPGLLKANERIVSSWSRLGQLVAPRRRHLVLAIGLAGGACLLALAGPILLAHLLSAANQRQGLPPLAIPAAVLLAAITLQAAAGAANNWLLGGISLDVVQELRLRLYSRLQQLPLAWFDRTPTGAIMMRLMDDVAAVQGLTSGQTLSTLLDCLTAIAAAGWVASCGWRLSAVLAAIASLYVFIFRLYTRRIHAGTLEVRCQLDGVFAQLKQKIDGIQVVRAASGEEAEVAAFAQQINALHEPRLHANQLGVAFSNLTVAVGGTGATLVFAIGAGEVMAGRLSIGELITASGLAALLFTPVTRLSELASAYQQASASFTRLGEILDHPPSVAGLTALPGVLAQAPAGCIEFHNVQFHYDAERPVLQAIKLRIEPGAKVAIVGPTGSGKTTLMNLLLRFYEPTGGEILFDGEPLSRLPLEQLRRHIGLVPQEAVIFRRTLAENIRYGAPHAGQAEIEAAARAALVHDLAMSLPDGYDTLIGEGGHPLSQGERQRIALARLFCKNPSVVVLDEATSSLDRASEALVQQALDRLLEGRTTLTIAHRLATVLDADRIIVMDQGRIVQSGPHAELLVDENGLYRRLCECQFGQLFPLPHCASLQPADSAPPEPVQDCLDLGEVPA